MIAIDREIGLRRRRSVVGRVRVSRTVIAQDLRLGGPNEHRVWFYISIQRWVLYDEDSWFVVEFRPGTGGSDSVMAREDGSDLVPGDRGGSSSGRTKVVTIAIMTIIIVIPAAYGFGARMLEFIRTYTSADGGGFAIVPILNYTLVSIGFICLMVWAVAHGMFRDIEKPKHTMLEQEERLDAHERSQGAARL